MEAMRWSPAAISALALCDLGVFCGTVAVLVRFMPEPLRPIDYLVIGAVATFAAMLLLFAVLIATGKRVGTSRASSKRRTVRAETPRDPSRIFQI